jgi:hypothetical protein
MMDLEILRMDVSALRALKALSAREVRVFPSTSAAEM